MKQTHYLTTTVQAGNRVELDLPTLPVGQAVEVILIVSDLAEQTATTVDRRAFLKLPLAERRRIMAQQAEAALPYYEQDLEWQEWANIDLVGCED